MKKLNFIIKLLEFTMRDMSCLYRLRNKGWIPNNPIYTHTRLYLQFLTNSSCDVTVLSRLSSSFQLSNGTCGLLCCYISSRDNASICNIPPQVEGLEEITDIQLGT